MLGPEKEILKIWAIDQGEDVEREGHLVLTDQRIAFYPTRWSGLARDQVLWWAHHDAVAHLEQWGTGILSRGNMLTISVRYNNYETTVYPRTVRVVQPFAGAAIRRFMKACYVAVGYE